MKIRASQLSRLMTMPKSKADKESYTLGETAKSYIKELAINDYFGIKKEVLTKQMDKGIQCEQDSIDLINLVEFTKYEKVELGIETEYLTGHPDIITDKEVLDVKTSWDATTFPWLTEDANKAMNKSGYDWQLRAYMMLFGLERGRIVYCLVDTPDELLNDWDDEELHKISHIPANKRITYSDWIERDEAIEDEIRKWHKSASDYYNDVIAELESK